MQTLIINLTATKKIHRTTENGRDYIVALSALIVPGVLDGSKGPLYYSPEEVANSAAAWNGVKVTVGHPSSAGKPISASQMREPSIGTVRNARFENDKLLADVWFDVNAIRYVDQKLFLNLMNNQPQELSTGLYADYEPVSAGSTFNGRRYDFIARNLKPDHLAILTDSKGACSRQDGCGILANQDQNYRGPGIPPAQIDFSDRKIDKTETKTETQTKQTTGRGPGLSQPVIDWSKKQ